MSFPLPVFDTNERYVFEVPSERNPKRRYRCDITSNGGAGRCSCPDFSMRRQVNIDAGMPMLLPATECKHLQSVHYVVSCNFYRLLAKTENGETTE